VGGEIESGAYKNMERDTKVQRKRKEKKKVELVQIQNNIILKVQKKGKVLAKISENKGASREAQLRMVRSRETCTQKGGRDLS